MKHTYLYFALWLCLLIVTSSYIRIFIFIVGSIYVYCHYGIKTIWGVIIIFLFLLFTHTSSTNIQGKVLQVEDIRTSYIVANDGKNKCILYNVDGVDLLDIIEVSGEYEEIYSNKNANTFQFETYMKQKGIHYSMYVQKYTLKAESYHPRAILYRYIKTKNEEVRNDLQSIFYRKQDEMDTNIIFASGMHLHFLTALLSTLINKRKSMIDLFVSFVYFVFFPVSSSILCMLFSALIKELFKNIDAIDCLGITMIVLLIYHPGFVYEISFQLSVLFRLVALFDYSRIHKTIKNGLLLFPFQLFHFHECYIIEILFFPFIRLLQGVTFLCAIFTLLISELYPILHTLIHINTYLNNWISSTYLVIGKPYYLWILYWGILFIQLLSQKKDFYFWKFAFLILIQINIANLHPLGEVTFLDVGQGDAIFIREPFHGKTMMIDVAGKVNDSIVEKRIYSYLKMEGIKEIDKVVITHEDYDHSGGLKELKTLIKVKEVVTDKKNITLDHLHFFSVSNDIYEDENDNSIVLYAQIGTLNYLFMADASIKIEKKIMDTYNKLNVDILKIGHHGSNTSSDLSFLLQMHPLISVISSGKNNRYAHPHIEVLQNLDMVDSYILNTQTDGSITIFFTSFINFVRTGCNEFAIIK